MAAILIFVALVAVCVLAGFAGVDSRFDEPRHHRPNWN